MRLFHTGYQEIKTPDIRHGRKNADFGQGFYMTADQAFAERWGNEMKDERVYVNLYELDEEGLSVKVFSRDMEWFRYIAGNRSGSRRGDGVKISGSRSKSGEEHLK